MCAINTIAVIDDEPDIRDTLDYKLTSEGYRVLTAADGEAGLELVRRTLPSLVLLDLMMPRLGGVEVCRALRSRAATRGIPVIMITSKGAESDVVEGLQVGADDYIVKPFGVSVVLARITAVLRRSDARNGSVRPGTFEHEGFAVDASKRAVSIDGRPVHLTDTEFRLLELFASNAGQVLSRDAILSRTFGENSMLIDRNVDVHVRSIREKLGDYRSLIETVRGIGYRFKSVGE